MATLWFDVLWVTTSLTKLCLLLKLSPLPTPAQRSCKIFEKVLWCPWIIYGSKIKALWNTWPLGVFLSVYLLSITRLYDHGKDCCFFPTPYLRAAAPGLLLWISENYLDWFSLKSCLKCFILVDLSLNTFALENGLFFFVLEFYRMLLKHSSELKSKCHFRYCELRLLHRWQREENKENTFLQSISCFHFPHLLFSFFSRAALSIETIIVLWLKIVQGVFQV